MRALGYEPFSLDQLSCIRHPSLSPSSYQCHSLSIPSQVLEASLFLDEGI